MRKHKSHLSCVLSACPTSHLTCVTCRSLFMSVERARCCPLWPLEEKHLLQVPNLNKRYKGEIYALSEVYSNKMSQLYKRKDLKDEDELVGLANPHLVFCPTSVKEQCRTSLSLNHPGLLPMQLMRYSQMRLICCLFRAAVSNYVIYLLIVTHFSSVHK